MTVISTEDLSTVAQANAARDAELGSINAERLASWQRRYPHDLVEVPQPVNPPEWPARRVSIDPPATVTRLRTRAQR